MDVWYTADLHFGHVNISTYSGRPFHDVEKMNNTIISRFNELVRPGDQVIVLGDVAMGRIADTLRLVSNLNGELTLVPGNHDRCWVGHGDKAAMWRQRYLDAGFVEIDDIPTPVTVAGTHVQHSHFPYRGGGDHGPVERHSEHRLVDRGDYLFHGHVHEKWKQRGRMINVGVDAWGGRPVHIDELVALITAGPQDLDCDSWESHR
jgi:calcineurin-like phosphoesterase family protein